MLRFGFTYRLEQAGKNYNVSALVSPDAITELAARAAAIRVGNVLREYGHHIPDDVEVKLTMVNGKVNVELLGVDFPEKPKPKANKKNLPKISLVEN